MVEAIDHELEATRMGITLKPEERFEVFGDFVPEDHQAEAEARWGTSPAFVESQRRVARYTKDDWLRVKKEAGDPGEMYVADPRFTSHDDDQAPGLAAYLRDAILANARRAGA
jgi:hypothetical protein